MGMFLKKNTGGPDFYHIHTPPVHSEFVASLFHQQKTTKRIYFFQQFQLLT